MEDDTAEKVTMVTVAKQDRNNEFKQYRNNDYKNNRSYRAPRENQGQRRGRQEPSGPPVTECAFCELMRNKDVNQELLRMDFNERHKDISEKPLYANQCLPWLRLSMEEREKVLENNGLRCKLCLRSLKQSSRNSTCGNGRHIFNNGKNGMCSDRSCEKNVTMCRDHYEVNLERHNLLRSCTDWADRVKPQPVRQHMSFLMQVSEDTESTSEKVLDDLSLVRKEIQINTKQDPAEVFNEIEHTTLVVVEDRRNNEAQFDLAYTNIDGEKILTTFDSCSNATLIHKDLIQEGKIKVLNTEESSNIKGIGGAAKGKIVEFEISNRFGTRIRIKASVVEKIAFVPPHAEQKYKELINASVKEVRKAEGYENATADNFQMVSGGKVELLLGLDAGNDFFPREISTYRSGLKISEYRMRLFDPSRVLGFSGSFPAKYTPMYSSADHTKALIMQEDPKIDGNSVFRIPASAITKR